MKPEKVKLSAEALKFIEEQPLHLHSAIIAIRNIIIEAVPHATERRVWNALSYYNKARGGPVKGAICQIEAKKGRLMLAFIQGASIKEYQGILMGDRLAKRYLPIEPNETLPVSAISRLISKVDSNE